jgi:hypothetical protein
LRQRLPDWSLRPALQVDLLPELVQLEVVLPLRVLPEEEAVAAPAASSSQVVADPAQQAAALRQPDSSAPELLDSYHRLPAALVPEVELVRAKPTRTRLQRDR